MTFKVTNTNVQCDYSTTKLSKMHVTKLSCSVRTQDGKYSNISVEVQRVVIS